MIKDIISRICKLCCGFPILALAACSGDDEGAAAPLPAETVQLYIAVPAAADTRLGDPGAPTGEGIDWDELAVMIEYVRNSDNIAMPTQTHFAKIISKQEFDLLPSLDAEGRVKRLALDVQPGDVHIYGVTYSSGIMVDGDKNLGDIINDWADNNYSQIANLTIPNSYADGEANSLAKFLSVATGYYADATTGDLGTYEIRPNYDDAPGQATPTMTLTRLAAKIDIQWDAADAYPAYTDVAVTGFSYNGGATLDGVSAGSGRFFPALYDGDVHLGGITTFYNTTEISRRNGRVYHYVFPDGTQGQSVTFSIAAKKGDRDFTNDYKFTFPQPLRQATWYKVNTRIRGLEGKTEFELSGQQSLTEMPGEE